MNLMRTILFSITAGAFCLAGSAAAQNTEVVAATANPARAGFAILSGDINGQGKHVVYSATVTGGLIALPVFLAGQPIQVTDVVGSTSLVVSQIDATGAGKFENVSGTNLEQSSRSGETRRATVIHVGAVDDPVNPLTMRLPTRQRAFFNRVLGDRTNVLYQSEDFSGTPWEAFGLTITDNDIVGPDGTEVADRAAVSNSSVQAHDIDQSYNGTANGIEYHAVWVKALGAQQWIAFAPFDATAGFIYVNFDIVNGVTGHVVNANGTTVQDWSVLDYGIEPYPEGWFLIWIFIETSDDTRRFTNLTLLQGNTNVFQANYAGNTADGVFLHGWMVITGVQHPLIPSPYIQSILGSTRDTSTTNYAGDVHVSSIGPGDSNIGNMDIEAADFAASSGTNPTTLIANGFADIGVTSSSAMRQATLLLKSNMTDEIKFSDDTVSGAQVVAGLGLLVVNAATKADAVMARQSGTNFLTSSGEKGFAAHVKVTEIIAALPTGTNNIGGIDVLSVIPGNGTTNLGKTTGAPAANAAVGVVSLGVRRDSPVATGSVGNGDHSPFSTNAEGVMYVVPTYDVVGDGTVSEEQTATPFSISGGESGTAAHTKVVELPDMVVVTQEFQLVIATSAHTSKKAVGGLMILDFANVVSGRSGIIQSVLVRDNDAENANLAITFFDNAYIAADDNDLMDPTDAEQDENIGVVQIVNGNYTTYSNNSVATRAGLGLAFDLSSTGFYAQAMIDSGVGTWSATTDLRIVVTIIVR